MRSDETDPGFDVKLSIGMRIVHDQLARLLPVAEEHDDQCTVHGQLVAPHIDHLVDLIDHGEEGGVLQYDPRVDAQILIVMEPNQQLPGGHAVCEGPQAGQVHKMECKQCNGMMLQRSGSALVHR